MQKFLLLNVTNSVFSPIQIPAKPTNSVLLLFPVQILQATPNEPAHTALNQGFKAKPKEDGFVPHPIDLKISSIFKVFIQV